MTVPQNSRYSQGVMTRIKNPMTGVFNLTVLRTVPAATSSYKLYTWQANDRADLVAAKELGNPTLWWSIFDINPEVINPLNVQPGTVLRLPQSPVVNQGTLMQ